MSTDLSARNLRATWMRDALAVSIQIDGSKADGADPQAFQVAWRKDYAASLKEAAALKTAIAEKFAEAGLGEVYRERLAQGWARFDDALGAVDDCVGGASKGTDPASTKAAVGKSMALLAAPLLATVDDNSVMKVRIAGRLLDILKSYAG